MRFQRLRMRLLAACAVALIGAAFAADAFADPKSVSVPVTRDSWAVMLPDGRSALVFAWEYDGTVVRVNLDSMTVGSPIRYWMKHPYEAVFTSDGQYGYFLSGHNPILDVPEGFIYSWNTEAVAKVRLSDLSIMWRHPLPGVQSKRQLILSPDESTVYVSGGIPDVVGSSASGAIRRINAADGTLVDGRETGLSSTTGLALLSNGNLLIASNDIAGGQVIEFNPNLARLRTFSGTGDVAYVKVMPDEQHAIVASYGSSFCYLNLSTSDKYCAPRAQYMGRAIPHSLVLNAAGDAAFSTQTIEWDYWGYQKAQGLLKIVPSGDSITVTEIGARQSGLYAMSTDTMTSRLLTYSPIERNIKLYELPTAPTNIASTPLDGGAQVTFTPGASRGLTITRYEYSVAGGAWNAASPTTTASPLTISGLTNDNTHEVRIRAVSHLGAGSASETITVKATAPPETPTALSAIRGNQSVEISFTPGQNGAMGPVWNYQYQVDTGTWTDLSPFDAMSPITVPLSDNDQSHTVRIRASNDAGPGPASAQITTPAIAPMGAPTSPSVTRDNGALSIAFTPGATGNQVLTGYQFSLDNGGTWQSQSPPALTSPIRVTGVNNSDTFTVRVRAVGGALGPSESSTSVNVVAVSLPSDPILKVVGLQTETATVQLAFDSDGGTPLLKTEVDVFEPDPAETSLWKYLKTLSRDRADGDTLTVAMTISGLVSGKQYLFVGTGTNRIGRNDVDDWRSVDSSLQVKTLETLSLTGPYPVQPLALAQRGGETITITGTDFYESHTTVTIGTSACLNVSVESATLLTCQTPTFTETGTATVTVSRWGESQSASGATNVGINPAWTPGSPTILGTSSTSNSILVYFKPGSDGGGDILNYEYAFDVPSVWIALSPDQTVSPLTISRLDETGTALSPNTAYKIYLRAKGSGSGVMAEGQVSADFSETTTSRLSAPTNFAVTSGNNKLDLAWTNPSSGSFSGIEYTLNGWETWTSVGTFTQMSVSGLENGRQYRVAVRGIESNGMRGASTALITGIPSTTPSAPTEVSASSSNGRLRVNFRTSANGGTPIFGYQYSLNGASWTEIQRFGDLYRSFWIVGSAGQAHTVRIRAENARGFGAPSETVTVRGLDTPATPTLTVESMTATTLTVLTAGTGSNGRPLGVLSARLWTWFGEAGTTLISTFIATETETVSRRLTFTNLNQGQLYFVQAIAEGEGGIRSSSTTSFTLSGAPAAPTIIGSANGSRQVSVQFTPSFHGSTSIQKYQFSTDGGANWRDRIDGGGLTSPMTISGLTNGKTYQVKLRAISQTETGTASAVVVAAPVSNCSGPALMGADFSGCDLRNRNDFANAELRFASFVEANISGVSFAGSDLYGANFASASAVTTDFTGANLRATGFSDTNLTNAAIDSGAGDVIGTPTALPNNRILVNGYFRSTAAQLSSLTLSAGSPVSLNQSFSTPVKTYSASVSAAVETVTVLPAATTNQSGIRVNSEFVPSGTESSGIALQTGTNVIDVVVTAPDGLTADTYTVTVTRGFVSGGGGSGGVAGGGASSAAPAGGGGAATTETTTATSTETSTAQVKPDTSTAGSGQGTGVTTPTTPDTATVVDTSTVTPKLQTQVIRLAFTYSPKQTVLSSRQLRTLQQRISATTKSVTVLGYVTRTKATSSDKSKSLTRAKTAGEQIRKFVPSLPVVTRGAGGAVAKGCVKAKNNCVVVLVTRSK